MYIWIWRHLPGTVWVRVASAVGIVVVFFAFMFTLVYPWLEPLLPFGQNTIGE